ncbi:hypothetical protein [Demequina aestuarii]|uniref:hypothetical protein n=1 Tax=Demequina aestuarii TaxID=327095 RepID=UPI00128C30DB|nr:hypothetical protein [Demequina aestuarii]
MTRVKGMALIRLPRGGVDLSAAFRGLLYSSAWATGFILIGLMGFIDPNHGRPTAWTQTVIPVASLIAVVLFMPQVVGALRSLRILPVLAAREDGEGVRVYSAVLPGRGDPVRREPGHQTRLELREYLEQSLNPWKRDRTAYRLEIVASSGTTQHFRLLVRDHVRDFDWCEWAESEFAARGIDVETNFQAVQTPSAGTDVVET